jgi:phosphoribosylformimino-5-aminoimidazole carboxamide ribotide isomerase
MILFPAIDIKDNKCVRLTQGKFDRVEVYSDDPVEMAKKWEAMGARYLHVVDLDGAKNEGFQNRR